MNRHALSVPALFVLALGYAGAYHVGEKPADRGEHHNTPTIIRCTTDHIEFTVTVDDPVELAVYDVLGNIVENNGRMVQTLQPVSGRGVFQLNLTDRISGVYFITLRNRFGITTISVAEVR
jgi:hypothetical protein